MTKPRKPFNHRIVLFFARASRSFYVPALLFTAVFYSVGFLSKPAQDVYSQTITALGVTLGLAAVCLSSTITNPRTLRALQEAGRQFLHASVLILQMLLLVFIRETTSGQEWWLSAIRTLYHLAAVLAVIPATWCWLRALVWLNDELWTAWIEELPATSSEARAAEPNP